MAWRIAEYVVRGEIDARMPGRVFGTIWLAGKSAPLELSLDGSCAADLVGRLLKFRNPRPLACPERLDGLAPCQEGSVSLMTASRKMRAPMRPPKTEAAACGRASRIVNALFLEWHSETNGRTLIEATDYHISVTLPVILSEKEESLAFERPVDFEPPRSFGSQEGMDAAFMQKPAQGWSDFDWGRLVRAYEPQTPRGGPTHPLVERVADLVRTMRLGRGQSAFLDPDAASEWGRAQGAAQRAWGRIHEALGPPEHDDEAPPALSIAWLKRALEAVHQALTSCVALEGRATASMGALLAETRAELFSIRQRLVDLMAQLRAS